MYCLAAASKAFSTIFKNKKNALASDDFSGVERGKRGEKEDELKVRNLRRIVMGA